MRNFLFERSKLFSMKKFVLLFTCMFIAVSVFAQTNFQELTLAKALEKAKWRINMFSWIVILHGVDRVR